MPIELNTDTFEIKNYELTPEGFLKAWFVGGIPQHKLVYDDGNRVETITDEELFNEDSINTAIGKPITLSHPPRPINSKNYRQYAAGVLLQEYAKDDVTGGLVLAGVIHDDEVVNGILTGKYKYVSAGYNRDAINQDGVLLQKNRKYNHLAVVTPDSEPRAGKFSRILVLDDTPINEDNPGSKNENKNKGELTMDEINERVEILTDWKSTLEENNKSYHNVDSKELKKQVLSCFYPEKTINLITDSNIDGFWLGFLTNHDSTTTKKYQPVKQESTNQDSFETNYDSVVDEHVNKFIAKMENRAA